MILVTGATGRVGRALQEVLDQGRREVLGTSLELPAATETPTRSDGPALGLADAQAAQVQSVIHLAGEVPGVTPAREDHEVRAMQELVRFAQERKVDRFVYLSATGAAPNAPVPFLRRKGHAEAILRDSGLTFVILRAGLVVMDGHPFLESLVAAVREGASLPLPWLNHGRLHGVSVEDVSIALATALDHHVMPGRTIELGAGPALTLAEWVEQVGARLGRRVQVRRRPFGGNGLIRRLQTQGALQDAATWLSWFAVAEPVDLALYERVLPMRRLSVEDALLGMTWGPPPLKPGDPLPTLQPSGNEATPAFIPGAHLLEEEERNAATSSPARYGQVDPFGNPLSEAPGDDDNAEQS